MHCRCGTLLVTIIWYGWRWSAISTDDTPPYNIDEEVSKTKQNKNVNLYTYNKHNKTLYMYYDYHFYCTTCLSTLWSSSSLSPYRRHATLTLCAVCARDFVFHLVCEDKNYILIIILPFFIKNVRMKSETLTARRIANEHQRWRPETMIMNDNKYIISISHNDNVRKTDSLNFQLVSVVIATMAMMMIIIIMLSLLMIIMITPSIFRWCLFSRIIICTLVVPLRCDIVRK